jgi:aspartyl-tRNA(Asn)/glutamyl-tRNA(Gln) amidotransferase subunit B
MYQSFVGLEIHIHLLTKSKVFCGCRSSFGDEPNTNICPVCMGYPGVLPALNIEAMRMGTLVARALGCSISPATWFERKQYFYPDMPKNYQISQFASPLGVNGEIELEFRRNRKKIRIKECHLEEDAGKMIHAGDTSLLDYNRAGVSLLEIVTEPDLEIGEEAELFLQQLRRTVRYLGVCDGNMEEGSMRCDANVSINIRGQGLGRKVEIKNLNSSRFVKLALNYEIERQSGILDKGGTVRQETRLWNENRDQTESMRSKESANDYRYFPEPDLPVFMPDADFMASVDAGLVELPQPREKRLAARYGLSESQASWLCEEKALADYFEAALRCLPVPAQDSAGVAPERLVVWMSSDVKRIMNRDGIASEAVLSMKLSPARLSSLVGMIESGRISGKIAKQVLELVFSDDLDPETVVESKGWGQITDLHAIAAAIDEAFAAEPEAVESAASGDAKIIGYLVGKALAATGGRADPKLVRSLVEKRFAARRVDLVSFGGAITGKTQGGLVVAGEAEDLRDMLRAEAAVRGVAPGRGIASESGIDRPFVQAGEAGIGVNAELLGSFLSEEVSPLEWSRLVEVLARKTSGDSADGLVVAQGTDTLAYTAPLVQWLFGDSGKRIVLAASTRAPANAREAAAMLEPALRAAADSTSGNGSAAKGVPITGAAITGAAIIGAAIIGAAGRGVVAMVDGMSFDPLNLKFLRVEEAGFGTWNGELIACGARLPSPFPSALVAEALAGLGAQGILARAEAAAKSAMILKIFPGMRGEIVSALMAAGCRNFILELYDTGTAAVGSSPYSLKEALRQGREKGAMFYCTSQQEGIVDFSGYVTAHELWKEGAVPMGALSTESVYARLVAAWIVAGTEAGARALMEESDASTGI